MTTFTRRNDAPLPGSRATARILVADAFEASGLQSLRDLGCDTLHEPELTAADLPARLAALQPEVLVVRETTARMLDSAQKLADEHYPGQYDLVLLDGFESGKRQASGFGRALKKVLAEKGIVDGKGLTLAKLFEAGTKAEGTYSSVKAETGSAGFDLATDALMGDATKNEIVEISKAHGLSINNVLFKLVTFMTNAGIEFTDIAKVALNFECNAHAGGSSADIMLTDKKGKLLNLVPYCFMGPEAGMAFMEGPDAYEKFMESVKTNPGLQDHLKKLGYESPEMFTRHEWDIFNAARRVRFHVFKSLGATFYSAHDPAEGGEDWHYESPGVRLYGPDGKLISETGLAGKYDDDSGNPGHTLQKLGPAETAVYGGGSAHKLARRDFGLED